MLTLARVDGHAIPLATGDLLLLNPNYVAGRNSIHRVLPARDWVAVFVLDASTSTILVSTEDGSSMTFSDGAVRSFAVPRWNLVSRLSSRSVHASLE